MAKQFKIIATIVVLIVVIITALFALVIIRGIRPVLINTEKNIADIIDSINEREKINSGHFATSTNTIGMPLALPSGFALSVFARDLGPVRVIVNLPNGGLLASITQAGQVVALPDHNGDGRADDTVVVLSGLYNPHGLVVRCAEDGTCELYVAETNAVSVYDYSPADYTAANRRVLFTLPDDGEHYTRTLLWATINGENKLLTSVGSSCNVCQESDNERAAILVSNMDGSGLKVFASGLRNSVFMNIDPITGDIWATDMGRDWLGDDLPPDEINIIPADTPADAAGPNDYGWPVCYGANVHDDNFDKNQYIRDPCADKTPAFLDIPAHSAPLGIDFIPEEGWPEDYWYNAIVAYHGSWNRTVPTGYKVVRVKLDAQGNYLGTEDFITGWLADDNDVLGRPVAVLIRPGGEMFISDDKAGVIYRVVYTGYTAEQGQGVQSDKIRLDRSLADTMVSSPLVLTGEARGTWYFEATFPAEMRDANGNVIASHYAQAQSDWMTQDFVPFKLELEFTPPATDTGELILRKDNPSGLPENDDAISFPVRFTQVSLETACQADSDCVLPGSYAIRSDCPYRIECSDNICTVICPDY